MENIVLFEMQFQQRLMSCKHKDRCCLMMVMTMEAMENKEITVMTVIPTPIDTKKIKDEQLNLIQFLRYSFIHFRFYRFISMI